MSSRLTTSLLPLFAAALLLGFTTTPAAARGWTRLGDVSVNERLDRDEIRVGLGRGTFRWVKLRVDRRAVEFRRITVTYGNGEQESIGLRRTIPAGGETRPIRLDNRGRIIRRVEFLHRTLSGSGRARVTLFGRN